mgnify:CR=1 FL=1
MAGLLSKDAKEPIDLVEAGAGSGRLSADILRAARIQRSRVYDRYRLHLVEASPPARDQQRATLGETARAARLLVNAASRAHQRHRVRERIARCHADASGRDARRRSARGVCQPDALVARTPAIHASARRVSSSARREARARLAGRNQFARDRDGSASSRGGWIGGS